MADNSLQGGTDSIRDKDRAGVKTQIVGLDLGIGTGTESLMSGAMPVSYTNTTGSGTFTAVDAVVAAPVGDGTIVSGASTAGSVIAVAIPAGHVAWTLLLKGLTASQTAMTIYSEASTNSTNGTDGDWVEIKGRRTGTAVGVESVAYAYQSNGYYRGNAAGFTWFRVRLLGAFTAGATAAITLSKGQGATFLNSGIPAGGSNIGSVNLLSSGGLATTSGTITATATNTPGVAVTASTTAQVVANTALAGNATFHVVTSAFNGTLIFEGSVDAGLNYAPLMAIREDGTGSETGQNILTAAAFIRQWTVALPGMAYFRVRCSSFASGSVAVIIAPGPTLFEPSPSLAASSATIGAVGINAGANAGANVIGTVNQQASTIQTALSTSGAAVTATLPAVANSYHYITSVQITLYSAAARTGSATPSAVSTTNLVNAPGWTFSSAGAIGATETQTLTPTTPIKSNIINTATTFVAAIATGGIWRINVTYYSAT